MNVREKQENKCMVFCVYWPTNCLSDIGFCGMKLLTWAIYFTIELCCRELVHNSLNLPMRLGRTTAAAPCTSANKWPTSSCPLHPTWLGIFCLHPMANRVRCLVSISSPFTSYQQTSTIFAPSIYLSVEEHQRPMIYCKVLSNIDNIKDFLTRTQCCTGYEVAHVERKMEPLLCALEQMVLNMQPFVDSRVLVSLTRGLWEHITDDLYVFVESLEEGNCIKVCTWQHSSILRLKHYYYLCQETTLSLYWPSDNNTLATQGLAWHQWESAFLELMLREWHVHDQCLHKGLLLMAFGLLGCMEVLQNGPSSA